MEFKTGDLVKVSEEVIEKTKRCRVNGKSIDGKYISFQMIMAGRNDIEMKVINTVGGELYLHWIEEETKRYAWVHKDLVVEAYNALNEAEEW